MANSQLSSWGTTFLAAVAEVSSAFNAYVRANPEKSGSAEKTLTKAIRTLKGTRAGLVGILSSSTITTVVSDQILTSFDTLIAKNLSEGSLIKFAENNYKFNSGAFIAWYNTYIKPLI
jgi:hypothetical protein